MNIVNRQSQRLEFMTRLIIQSQFDDANLKTRNKARSKGHETHKTETKQNTGTKATATRNKQNVKRKGNELLTTSVRTTDTHTHTYTHTQRERDRDRETDFKNTTTCATLPILVS
jgi:cobyrinic acid a,c-diamide synthase